MPASSSPVFTTYIGGPTVLIEVAGLRFLTDPTLDPPGQHYEVPRTGSEIHKTGGPGLTAEQIGPVDIVLLSHDEHADNLDDAGRKFLAHATHTVTTKGGAARLGAKTTGLQPFEAITLLNGKVKITATPARHGPEGCEPLLGEVIGFAVESPAGLFEPFYVSGDTVFYDELYKIKEKFRFSTAYLFLGRAANGKEEPHFTLDAEEACRLALLLKAEKIVPLHYEDWAHYSEDRAYISTVFNREGLASQVRWLEKGIKTQL